MVRSAAFSQFTPSITFSACRRCFSQRNFSISRRSVSLLIIIFIQIIVFIVQYFNLILSLLSNCKKFGRQSWVVLSIIATEFLIIAKFDWQTITKPLPRHVFYFWVGCAFLLFLWTIWNFFLRQVTKVLYKRKDSMIESKRSPNKLDSNSSNKTISNKSNGSTIDEQINSHKKRK
jgi:hypothetical protein